MKDFYYTEMLADRDAWKARAEAAEKALYELTEPISDAGHTTADGLRHELQQVRARAEAAEKELTDTKEWAFSWSDRCTDAEKRVEAAEKALKEIEQATTPYDEAHRIARAMREAKPSSILPTAAPWEGGKP